MRNSKLGDIFRELLVNCVIRCLPQEEEERKIQINTPEITKFSSIFWVAFFKERKRQAQRREKCHSNLAFVPSHPIPFRMASLSHEILLLSVKLQKGEQQLNGEWGRKHQLYGDPIQGSQPQLSKAFFRLGIVAKWHQGICAIISKDTNRTLSLQFKQRKVSGQQVTFLKTAVELSKLHHWLGSHTHNTVTVSKAFSTTHITYTFDWISLLIL